MDLDRLRRLTLEPDRAAMVRTGQFPSMTNEVLRQKQEIHALRRGLAEAIVEIERYAEQAANAIEILNGVGR